MEHTHMSSTDPYFSARHIEQTFVPVDLTTVLLFYFSVEELAELTPGELHLLAALRLEQANQTQDMHNVGTVHEYQERLRRIVTKTDDIPNRGAQETQTT